MVAEPVLAVDDIQGDSIAGFRKDYLNLVFFQFDAANVAGAKAWLSGFCGHISTARQVTDFNTVFRSMRIRLAREPFELSVLWRNIGFTSVGLAKLVGQAEVNRFADGSFKVGAQALSSTVGDPTDGSAGDPRTWIIGANDKVPDGVVLLAGDRPDDLQTATEALIADLKEFVSAAPFVQAGRTRPGAARGHEHFGFKDGISQPGIRGTMPEGDFFTPRFLEESDPNAAYFAAPGQPLIWPGEILLNLPKQKGANSDPLQSRTVADGPPWATNGSYLVFRRLQQDVSAFNAMVQAVLTALGADAGFAGIDQARVEAMLVGRFKSGCPLMRSITDNGGVAADPYAENNFLYANDTPAYEIRPNNVVKPDAFPPAKADPSGTQCPLSGHVRKVNPRDQSTDVGSGNNTLQRRIARRGIPYGGEFDPANPDNERGLLFLCYQSSIIDQFEFLMRDWANSSKAPQDPSGFDAVLSPNVNRFFYATRPDGTTLQVPLPPAAVTATGAAYIFIPPISALTGVLSK